MYAKYFKLPSTKRMCRDVQIKLGFAVYLNILDLLYSNDAYNKPQTMHHIFEYHIIKSLMKFSICLTWPICKHCFA